MECPLCKKACSTVYVSKMIGDRVCGDCVPREEVRAVADREYLPSCCRRHEQEIDQLRDTVLHQKNVIAMLRDDIETVRIAHRDLMAKIRGGEIGG